MCHGSLWPRATASFCASKPPIPASIPTIRGASSHACSHDRYRKLITSTDNLRRAGRARIAVAILALAVVAACRQDMHDQPRYDPLSKSAFFADQRAARPLVAGTVARGHLDEDAAFFR